MGGSNIGSIIFLGQARILNYLKIPPFALQIARNVHSVHALCMHATRYTLHVRRRPRGPSFCFFFNPIWPWGARVGSFPRDAVRGRPLRPSFFFLYHMQPLGARVGSFLRDWCV